MSAWYVLSSLGIYDVTPGSGEWTSTKPYFSFKLHTEDGKVVTSFSDIVANGPNLLKNATENLGMHQFAKYPVPTINGTKSFGDKAIISIDWHGIASVTNPAVSIRYKVTYNESVENGYDLYTSPFEIHKDAKVEAFFDDRGEQKTIGSNLVSATFFKRPNDYNIAIKSDYNKQYTAGGPEGILDGIKGTTNWRKGGWQGYQGTDFEAVVDLKKDRDVMTLHARFLQDSRAWIMMPTKVEFYISEDNIHFTLVKTIDNKINPKDETVKIIDFGGGFAPTKARYIKVKAYNFGKLPEWHQGAGGDSFIFIDEIIII
jgi:hypothetical protein